MGVSLAPVGKPFIRWTVWFWMDQKGLLVTKKIIDIGTQGAKFYEAKAYQYFDGLNLLSGPND